MTNFGRLSGFLQSAAVRSTLLVMAGAVVLSVLQISRRAKGYKKDKLYPSVTTADGGCPPLSDTLNDTWKKIVQAVSPDNAARQPDSENAVQGISY